ncbi:hypothetical protein llg_36500 [Luteolibacter sp. LG18]|nr:hypothetical protein llg_36500 [Luteolibacter sp. LG18]
MAARWNAAIASLFPAKDDPGWITMLKVLNAETGDAPPDDNPPEESAPRLTAA